MIEMIILINDCITNITYLISSKDLRIGFKNGIRRFLRDEGNIGFTLLF